MQCVIVQVVSGSWSRCSRHTTNGAPFKSGASVDICPTHCGSSLQDNEYNMAADLRALLMALAVSIRDTALVKDQRLYMDSSEREWEELMFARCVAETIRLTEEHRRARHEIEYHYARHGALEMIDDYARMLQGSGPTIFSRAKRDRVAVIRCREYVAHLMGLV